MKNKNKNGNKRNKYKNKSDYININKKLLNNKKNRKEKSEFINDNIDNIYEIPGYYYDKEKNRFFSLNDAKTLNINFNEKKKVIKTSIKPKIKLSNFNIIRCSKFYDKKILKKNFNRMQSLVQSSFIKMEYDSDKLPNSVYLFYDKKYLLKLDYYSPNNINDRNNNNIFTNIIIHDVINNNFVKKIVIEEIYNDIMIKENNLILIDNITKLSIIKNIDEIIELKDKKIEIKIVNKFNIKLDNIDRISMVYKWPFININNNYYYYLVWNNFYYFEINEPKNKLILPNSDIIYLSKTKLIENNFYCKINKINIQKKYHYINFFINNNKNNNNLKFFFFEAKGDIHYYKFNKNNIFVLKQIISNEMLNNIQIINTLNYGCNNGYLLISNKEDIFYFDIINQTMTRLNMIDNSDNKNIKFKMKIFEYNEDLNCLIYDDDQHIKIFSLDDFNIIKEYKYDDYKYNMLIINNELILI